MSEQKAILAATSKASAARSRAIAITHRAVTAADAVWLAVADVCDAPRWDPDEVKVACNRAIDAAADAHRAADDAMSIAALVDGWSLLLIDGGAVASRARRAAMDARRGAERAYDAALDRAALEELLFNPVCEKRGC
ncbi:MAG: hypothetical protein GF393_04530 [Armatimonadia bacterium]|nr:hypothetical protein [Armatimonadia bacterium]